MYRIYIGSNNQTHKIEISKIKTILNQYFTGYTIIHATGYWNNTAEQSIIVEINASKRNILKVAGVLKAQLQQDAIGLTKVPALQFI